MSTKNTLYIAVLAVMFLSSLILLVFYYNQDVSENINLVNAISYQDLQINSYSYDETKTTLESVRAEIGSVSVNNNGVFTYVYSPPVLVGCINFVENPSFNRGFFIDVGNSENLKGEYYYGGYYSNQQTFEVKVGNKEIYDLVATYRPYNALTSDFSKEKIKGVSIYQLTNKQTNPFEDSSYGQNIYYSYSDVYCDRLEADKEPIKVIPVI